MDDSQLQISKYKKRVGISSLLLLFLGLVSGLVLVRQRQIITREAAFTPTEIQFITDSITVEPNQNNIHYDIYMNTNGNPVTAFSIEVDYDPDIIEVTDIETEWMVEDEDGTEKLARKLGDNTPNNKLTLGVQHPLKLTSDQPETIKIASVVFNTKDIEESTDISFTTNTKMASIVSEGDVLGTKNSGTVVIASAGTTPPTCPGEQTYCVDQCTDTETDNENCGSCGVSCDPGTICSFGRCAPPPSTPTPTDTCVPVDENNNSNPQDYSAWTFNFHPLGNPVTGGRNEGDLDCNGSSDPQDYSAWARFYSPF